MRVIDSDRTGDRCERIDKIFPVRRGDIDFVKVENPIPPLPGNAKMRDRLLAAEIPDGVLSLIRDSASVL